MNKNKTINSLSFLLLLNVFGRFEFSKN
jgi:hypothetical protein